MCASLSSSPKLPSFKCHSQDVGHIPLLSVFLGFPGRASGKKKNLPAHAGYSRDVSSVPGLGRSPGGGPGNPL